MPERSGHGVGVAADATEIDIHTGSRAIERGVG